ERPAAVAGLHRLHGDPPLAGGVGCGVLEDLAPPDRLDVSGGPATDPGRVLITAGVGREPGGDPGLDRLHRDLPGLPDRAALAGVQRSVLIIEVPLGAGVDELAVDHLAGVHQRPVGVLAQLLAELDPLLPGADRRADLVRLARQFRLGEQVAAVVEAGRTGVHRPEAEPAGRRGAELPLPWVEVLLDLRRAEVTQVV